MWTEIETLAIINVQFAMWLSTRELMGTLANSITLFNTFVKTCTISLSDKKKICDYTRHMQ